MAEQPPKTRVLTLRVGEDDHTEILRKTKEAGMTTSEFLRDVFINAKLTFNVKEPLIYSKTQLLPSDKSRPPER
ncbi:hypothetical protein AL047_09680 [Pseudomonas syringae pv. broussonetiae]|nr:hypothetical protein AL047_09680 [Pseudomonas syringae pv. broussonetiae]